MNSRTPGLLAFSQIQLSRVSPSPKSSPTLSRKSGRAFPAVNPPKQVFQNILLAQPLEAQVWSQCQQ